MIFDMTDSEEASAGKVLALLRSRAGAGDTKALQELRAAEELIAKSDRPGLLKLVDSVLYDEAHPDA